MVSNQFLHNTHKPKSEPSVRGLYLAGADAGSKGMGTHQSASSGMMVADMVQRYRDKRFGQRSAAS
jgi:phytoene dehydrogenase-like protein